jgi:hypothetical protein
MLRRVLALIVVIGLLAGRLAAIPHAHAEMNTTELYHHSQTPHIHLHAEIPGGHPHGHSDEDHGHPDSVPGEKLVIDPDSLDQLGISGNSESDHDSDAVPLAPLGCDELRVTGCSISADFPAVAASLLVAERLEVDCSAGTARTVDFASRVLDDSSELYLTLRTLRI